MNNIDIANEQTALPVDELRLRQIVEAMVEDEFPAETHLSLAVVDDATIARLHEEFLDEPGPTDVLSFLLEQEGDHLDGEVVASAETALREAPRYGWSPAEELLLYLVHGLLHLAGYDDETAAQQAAMHGREAEILARFGITARHQEVVEGLEENKK